ncbi:MAG: DHH family phosphoesterase [Candidatus Helarchaeota archaeon]
MNGIKKIPSEKKIVGITHKEDLDGIISISLLIRKFGNSMKIILTNYLDLKENLKKILLDSFDQIFISDLGFNEGFNELIPLFQSSKSKITWFDHHFIPEKLKKSLQDKVILYHSEDKTVASELIQQHYFKNDDSIRKLAKLAHLTDNKIQNDVADKLQLIIESFQDDDSKLFKLINYLSNGIYENEWIDENYLAYKKYISKEYDKIIERIEEYQVQNVKITISWSDIVFPSRISQYLLQTRDTDISIGINTRSKKVNLKSKKYKVRKVARDLHGGGHDYRAGFIYEDEMVSENKRISKKLIQEILDKIKKNFCN